MALSTECVLSSLVIKNKISNFREIIDTMAEKVERIKLLDRKFKTMIPAEEIDKAVQRVADQLNKRYEGKTPIFLGVLSGAFLFLSDLVRKTTFDSRLAFVKISSYEGTQSTGSRQALSSSIWVSTSISRVRISSSSRISSRQIGRAHV